MLISLDDFGTQIVGGADECVASFPDGRNITIALGLLLFEGLAVLLLFIVGAIAKFKSIILIIVEVALLKFRRGLMLLINFIILLHYFSVAKVN